MKILKRIGKFLLGVVVVGSLFLAWIVISMMAFGEFMQRVPDSWGAIVIEFSMPIAMLVGIFFITSYANEITGAFLGCFKRILKKIDKEG